MNIGTGPVIFTGAHGDDLPDSGLTIGALYFCEGFDGTCECTHPFLFLRGNPGIYRSYCGRAFQPLGEGNETVEREERKLEPA